MSDETALLRAIGLHPEEDTPRLVYADWLEEHGSGARAEFIRLSCELARMEDEDTPGRALRDFLLDKDEHIVRGDWRRSHIDKIDWSEIEPWFTRHEELELRLNALRKREGEDVAPDGPARCGVVWWAERWRGFPSSGSVRGPTVLCRQAKQLRATVPCARLRMNRATEATGTPYGGIARRRSNSRSAPGCGSRAVPATPVGERSEHLGSGGRCTGRIPVLERIAHTRLRQILLDPVRKCGADVPGAAPAQSRARAGQLVG
jgi:uncharacterized protein (TIGR02996 family)